MRFPQGVHFNNNKVVSHAILVAILIFYFLIFLKLYLNYISIQDNNCKLKIYNANDMLQMSSISLCKKCPNTEFFLVLIFPYLDWIRENTNQKKPQIWTYFT